MDRLRVERQRIHFQPESATQMRGHGAQLSNLESVAIDPASLFDLFPDDGDRQRSLVGRVHRDPGSGFSPPGDQSCFGERA